MTFLFYIGFGFMNTINVGDNFSNYFFLGSASGRLMVDNGWPGTLPGLLAVLKHKGISLSQIGFQLAIHYHPDLAGLMEDLKDKGGKLILPDAQISAVNLLRTFMNPSAPYVDIRMVDNLTVKLEESRTILAGIWHCRLHSPYAGLLQ